MIRLLLFSLLFCIGVRAQTTPFRVNGVIKNNPNLATSATALVSASGSTISISPTNLANAQIAAGAAIAASKLDTTLMTEAEVAALYQPVDLDLNSLSSGITGLVKGLGNGSGYSAAVAGVDYQSPIWTNDNGMISATSTVAEGGTAFSLNSSNTLSDSKLFVITNGNRRVFEITTFGATLNTRDTDNGTNFELNSPTNTFNFGIATTDGSAGFTWDMYLYDTRGVQRYLLDLWPSASDGARAYYFNTLDPHSSGNLFELANRDTNVFTIDWQGNVTANGVNATNFLRLNGADATTKTGSSAAGDVAVFDGTGQTLRRSTSAARLGDDSAASYVLTLANSETDVTLTASSGNLTAGGIFNGSDIRSPVYWVGSTPFVRLMGPSDGVLLIQDNGVTDFNRLQFGGTSSSFPALKRSTTTLQARLADDSAFAGFSAANATLANPTANTPTLTLSGGSNTGSDTTPGETFAWTWNTSGNVIAKRSIVTDTASGSTSALESWETAAGAKFQIFKDGAIAMPDTKIIYDTTTRNNQMARFGTSISSFKDAIGIGTGATGPSAPVIGLAVDASGQARISNGSSGTSTLKYSLRVTPAVAGTIASAATIAPTAPITFISGTTPIDTITAPSPISATGGQLTLIPTEIWTTTTSGNVALATTAVVSKALILTYDQATAKWYPSY